MTDNDERRYLDRIAAAVAEVVEVQQVSIGVIDRGRQWVAGSHGIVTLSDPIPLCFEVATSGRPVLVQDGKNRHGGPIPPDLTSFAGVPLPLRHGQRVGALAVFTTQRRAWQDRDLVILRSFADAAAAILDTWARCSELNADRAAFRAAADPEITPDESGGES